MNENHIQKITANLNIKDWQVKNTIQLFDEGATMPFISRYRKEATGSLDEVQIAAIKEQLTKLLEIDSRRETILKAIDEQGKLTEDLKKRIEEAQTLTELEDIYLPYKQKKKTRAVKAKEKGLEPLAKIIMKQQELNITSKAETFINDEVPTTDDALQGARDIIAEWINENERARNNIRRLFKHEAMVQSKVIKGKELEGIKFKDYFEWSESVTRAPSHRVLAMRRGEKEGFITMKVTPPQEEALKILEGLYVKGESPASLQVLEAAHDCYKRLLSMSMETEVRLETKKYSAGDRGTRSERP